MGTNTKSQNEPLRTMCPSEYSKSHDYCVHSWYDYMIENNLNHIPPFTVHKSRVLPIPLSNTFGVLKISSSDHLTVSYAYFEKSLDLIKMASPKMTSRIPPLDRDVASLICEKVRLVTNSPEFLLILMVSFENPACLAA